MGLADLFRSRLFLGMVAIVGASHVGWMWLQGQEDVTHVKGEKDWPWVLVREAAEPTEE